jgi:hypothetical protein
LEAKDLAVGLGHPNSKQIIVHDTSVLIINLKSIKYAKQLVNRLYDQEYAPGFIMKGQLELNFKKYLKQQQSQSQQQQMTTFSGGLPSLSLETHKTRFDAHHLSKSSNDIGIHIDERTIPTMEVPNVAADDDQDHLKEKLPRSLTAGDLIDPRRVFDHAMSSVIKQAQDDKKIASSVVSRGTLNFK